MAEAILRNALPNTSVSSAGLDAVIGAPAHEHTHTVMQELNIDIKDHVARQLTPEIIKSAELVIVMTNSQKTHIETIYPWTKGRIFRLGQWDRFDIDDPIGFGLDHFFRVRHLIEQTTESWIKRFA